MTREEAKNYFKMTGKKIGQLKRQYRNNQRMMPVPKIYSSDQTYYEYFGPLFESRKMSKEFRLRHIAYSLMRGRRYEEIESRVREENLLTELDWEKIEKYKREYEGPWQTRKCSEL